MNNIINYAIHLESEVRINQIASSLIKLSGLAVGPVAIACGSNEATLVRWMEGQSKLFSRDKLDALLSYLGLNTKDRLLAFSGDRVYYWRQKDAFWKAEDVYRDFFRIVDSGLIVNPRMFFLRRSASMSRDLIFALKADNFNGFISVRASLLVKSKLAEECIKKMKADIPLIDIPKHLWGQIKDHDITIAEFNEIIGINDGVALTWEDVRLAARENGMTAQSVIEMIQSRHVEGVVSLDFLSNGEDTGAMIAASGRGEVVRMAQG